MNASKAILTVLVGCYLTLWAGGVGSHLLFGRAPVDASWAAPAFLSLAGLITLLKANRKERPALIVAGALGFIAEVVGVHFGLPFGRYEYTDALRPQFIGVPLVMFAAWMALIAYVKAILAEVRFSAWLAAIIAGLWMTAIDLVIDPLAAGELSYWRWIDVGRYYGVPAQNFLGWFAVSLFIFGLVNLIDKGAGRPNPWARAIGLSILLFFALVALAHRLDLVASIGLGLCLIDAGARVIVRKAVAKLSD
jgi:putative membrane protein